MPKIIFIITLCLSYLSSYADFNKLTISNNFLSEGVTVADINSDGANDIVTGAFWFAGPEFKTRHQIRPLTKDKFQLVVDEAYKPEKYSNEFIIWTQDLNNDNKPDVLIAGVPGTPLLAYLNPGNENKTWEEHNLFDVVDNESPELIDIDGDGKVELICNFNGTFGFAKMNAEKPLDKWQWFPVSPNGKWGRFTHGIGAGDVDGDGKVDILAAHGWYKQPEKIIQGTVWEHFPQTFAKSGAQIFVYDVDADGKNDVITAKNAHGFGLSWYKNLGENKFTENVIMGDKTTDNPYGVKFSQLHALQLVDMNGDGLKDIVTGKRWWAHGPKGDEEPGAPAVLYYFQLKRDGDKIEFTPKMIDDNSGVGTQLFTGDINKDGQVDVAISNKKGVFLFINKSLGK